MIILADVIDYDIKGSKEIVAKGNKIFELNSHETLLQFDHPVIEGISILNNDTFYGSDLWGTKKVLKSAKVTEVTYVVKSILSDEFSIVLFKKNKTTAKIDLDANIIWRHQFYPVLGGILNDAGLVVLLDGAGKPEKRLLFVKITSGEILSSFDCGENLPRVLGANSEIVWIASIGQKYIKSIDPETGQIIDEVSLGAIQKLIQSKIDIEYFKFETKSLKLIHPLGDFELSSMRFVKRKYFESLDISGDVWVPSVFPFAFDDNYLVFGLQVDNSKNKDTETRLIVVQRNDDYIRMDVLINVEKPAAGLKKIALTKEKLIYIDGFNNLHKLKLNQLA